MAIVRFVPFRFWRRSLGAGILKRHDYGEGGSTKARLIAAHVERAAARLPGSPKCLPKAMALGTLLRESGIEHELVIAARPRSFGQSADTLHAWVEHRGTIILGELPGPWIEIRRSPVTG